MEQNEYLIGDVAQIVGVSKDTLRLYEKKGILQTRTKKNGYHYYTDDDIFQLSSILYHRKMNIGLEQIEVLWSEDHTFQSYEALTKQKILEIENTILLNQQVLGRLKAIQDDYTRIREHLGHFSICQIPDGFIIDTCATPFQAIIRYFQLSQQHAGLDLCYAFDFYQYQAGFSIGESQLLSTKSILYYYSHLTAQMYLDYDFTTCQKLPVIPCIYTIIQSSSRTPDIWQIERLRQWAMSQAIMPSAEVISSYIMRGNQNGKPIYYLDVFVPILHSNLP